MVRYNNPRDTDLPALMKKLRDDISRLQKTTRATQTSVTDGDMEIADGASVRVTDGGNLVIEDGGLLEIMGGGKVTVADGGDLEVTGGLVIGENGRVDGTLSIPGMIQIPSASRGLIARWNSTQESVHIGPVTADVDADDDGQTLRIRDKSNRSIFEASLDRDNYRRVVAGTSSAPLNQFFAVSDTVTLDAKNAGISLILRSAGNIALESGGLQVTIDHDTTSSAANCFIGTGGRIWRSTSSSKYKQDIKNAGIDPELFLKFQPRVWRDKNEVAENPSTTRQYIGFIAEEVAELDEDGYFIVTNDDGEPEAVQYDRIIAAAHATIVDQQKRIETLERVVSELIDRLK
jgi:hypothetical protein